MKQYRAFKFVTAGIMTAVLTFGAMYIGAQTGRTALGTPVAASAENNSGTDAEVYLPDIDEYRDVVNKISLSAASEHTPAGEPEWEWNNNIAEAHFVCADCGKKYCVEQIVPETKYKVINSHSETKRYSLQRYYEAKINLGGKEYTDTLISSDNEDDNLPLEPIKRSDIYFDSNYVGGRVRVSNAEKYLSEHGYDKTIKYGYCGYINGRWKMLAESYKPYYILTDLKPDTFYKMAVIYKIEGVWIKDFSNEFYIRILSPESLRYPTFTEPPICTTVCKNGGKKVTHIDYTIIPIVNADRTVLSRCGFGLFAKKAGKWVLIYEIASEPYFHFEYWRVNGLSPEVLRAGSKVSFAVCAKIDGEWDMSNIEKRAYTATVTEMNENEYNSRIRNYRLLNRIYLKDIF